MLWTERGYSSKFLFFRDSNRNNLCRKLKPLFHSLKYLFLRRRRRGAAEGHKALDDETPASSHISLQQLQRSEDGGDITEPSRILAKGTCPLFKPLNSFCSCQLPQMLNSISQTNQKKLLQELSALTRFIWSPFWALFSWGAYQTKGLFPVWNSRIGDDTYRLNVHIIKKSIPDREHLYKKKLTF